MLLHKHCIGQYELDCLLMHVQAILCEYSPRDGLYNIWKYDLPRIRDWTDANTKSLHELIHRLKDGYKTSKVSDMVFFFMLRNLPSFYYLQLIDNVLCCS